MNLAAWLLASSAVLFQHYADFYKETDLKKALVELEPDFGLPRITEYDYIIVGGGTAGCLLASRLSEMYKVLLLEKGGDPPPMTYPNFYYSEYATNLNINDAYELMPQENYALETPGSKFQYVGRMLGGTGSHNANYYNRGSPKDYDNWANLTGDNSWSYENIVPHYKNMEDFVGWLLTEGERDTYYGKGGPLQVTTYQPQHLNAWLEAGKEQGYPSGDPNGRQKPSFTTAQVSMRNQVRESSYTAFLKPAENRTTLKVLRYSEVDKVLVSDGNAYGVTFKRHGMPQIAHAKREVILSAGTLASPLILIKSGIGPKELLQEAEIPLVSDVPGVGKNLRDHPAVAFSYRSKNSGYKLTDVEFQSELQKFHSPQRQGIFTKSSTAQAFGTSSRAKKDDQSDWADLHIFSSVSDMDSSMYSITVALGRPKSVGEMFFNVTAYKNGERDTAKLGRPDFKYFSAEGEIDALLEGIYIGVKAYERSKAFKDLDLKFFGPMPKACESLVPNWDEFWKCFIKQKTVNLKHNVGTCKMGRSDDEMAVVDSKLRVRGVGKLRVVDASVMPQVVDANTNAATLLIAEKMGAEILQEG